MEKVLKSLNALAEDDAVKVIIGALTERPELAAPVVDAACPDLTYAPAKAVTQLRAKGTIKKQKEKGINGFIKCPDLEAIFGHDVFLHKYQMGQFVPGDEVSFAVFLNKDNKPQAFDLASAKGPVATKRPQEAPPAAPPKKQRTASEVPPVAAPTSRSAVAPPPHQESSSEEEPPKRVLAPVRSVVAAPPPPQEESSSEEEPVPKRAPAPRPVVAAPSAPHEESSSEEEPVPKRAPAPRPVVAAPLPADDSSSEEAPPPKKHAAARPVAAATSTAAPPASTGERYTGKIKSFNNNSGFGFIECAQTHAVYNRDVFLHFTNMGSCETGDAVTFGINLNPKGQPQALEVRKA